MRSWLTASAQPLCEVHDVALLDLDGVVYIGADAVPGAADALAVARQRGMRLAFVTNNAARPPATVATHLTDLGIAAEASEIITSAQAAARYLSERLAPGERVLVVGAAGLHEALRERGLTPVSDADCEPSAVVQGFSPQLDWTLLAEGSIAISRGLPWVATNADPTVPSPRGRVPGNGSFVAALRHATGRDPVVTGKPDPTMHRESLLRSAARRPIVVGDRLDTDIEGANAVGCPSLLVFSGVTDVPDLLAAPSKLRPTYIAADLRGLLRAQIAPDITADRARCGAWDASAGAARDSPESGARELLLRRRGGTGDNAVPPAPAGADLDESFDDEALDAVRALAAAAWTAADGSQKAVPAGGPITVRAEGEDAVAMARRLGLT